MVYLNKILVTTDMSDYSLAAVEYASSLGLLYNSTMYLLHLQDETPPVFRLQGVDVDPHQFRQRAEEDAQRELEDFAAKRVTLDLKFIPVVRSGSPAEEIKRFGEEEGIDLIVIATHGRTGLQHIVLGSVAEKVVRGSSVPVLAVKPRTFRESIIESEDIEDELHLR
jgi:nucleotide-binding universal stress UspA family protein